MSAWIDPSVSVTVPPIESDSYPIFIGAGLLDEFPAQLPRFSCAGELALVTDDCVLERYGLALGLALEQAGYRVVMVNIPSGESSKTQDIKTEIETRMLSARLGRDAVCLALGGGVIGDLTGFVAATYFRGIPFIQLPTTLLSMIDSSVGGKTGVNAAFGKNLIGAFWQPRAVVADLLCLRTLPRRQWLAGLFEAVKIFLTSDRAAFDLLERSLDALLSGDEEILDVLIRRAVALKAEVVSLDPREVGLRAVLNLGHTIGHALEYVSHWTLLHGEAVGYGIVVEAQLSASVGLLNALDLRRVESILFRLGLRAEVLGAYPSDAIVSAALGDKKVKAGRIHCVLLSGLGSVWADKGAYAHLVDEKLLHVAIHNARIGLEKMDNAGK